MSAQSITLARGETLEIVFGAVNDGVVVPIDETWAVASWMQDKAECGDKVNLTPTISGGVASVSYDTTNLPLSSYVFDTRLDEPGTGKRFSPKVFLYLTDTITPVT